MDIQSSALNELFSLFPVIIPGWVTPVKWDEPKDEADGGIPRVLYDGQAQGLEILIDPWTELQRSSWTMAADDRVNIFVNTNPTAATGTTVKKGEEQDRVRLYLPHGWLNQGVNEVFYTVTRVSGNGSPEPSRKLKVLYHLRLSEALDLVIPPEIIKNGVGPEDAAKGVLFKFTYAKRRAFERIEFLVGDTSVFFDVPDASTLITQTLYTDAFQRAGDDPNAVLEFKVYDQLGNFVRSSEKRLNIHLGRLTLQPPTVRGMNGNQFSPTTPEIRVIVPAGLLKPDYKVSVTWKGATNVTAGSYTSTPRLVSDGLEIAVPRSVLAYSLAKQVEVRYVIEHDGDSTESPPLLLNILPLPATALIPPKIVEADANNFLDVTALGTKNVTIHALLHPLIEAGQPCWLRLEGKKSDGSVHDQTLWNGLPAQVNSKWISQGFWPHGLANSYVKQLGHNTLLTIKYAVALDKSNLEANAVVFPDRTYTVKAAVALAIDDSQMLLHAVKLLQNYGWGSKEVPGNVDTRQATGGTPPYIYQSDNPAVASVTSDGKVTGLKNGATTIRVSDQSGSTVSFAVDVRNVFQVIRGSATYSGNPQGDLDAQRWVYSQGGVKLPDNSYLEPLLANFTNVYGDVFEGVPISLPRGKCCVESAVPPTAYHGSWMGMSSDGTFWFSSGSQPQLARAIAFVPT